MFSWEVSNKSPRSCTSSRRRSWCARSVDGAPQVAKLRVDEQMDRLPADGPQRPVVAVLATPSGPRFRCHPRLVRAWTTRDFERSPRSRVRRRSAGLYVLAARASRRFVATVLEGAAGVTSASRCTTRVRSLRARALAKLLCRARAEKDNVARARGRFNLSGRGETRSSCARHATDARRFRRPFWRARARDGRRGRRRHHLGTRASTRNRGARAHAPPRARSRCATSSCARRARRRLRSTSRAAASTQRAGWVVDFCGRFAIDYAQRGTRARRRRRARYRRGAMRTRRQYFVASRATAVTARRSRRRRANDRGAAADGSAKEKIHGVAHGPRTSARRRRHLSVRATEHVFSDTRTGRLILFVVEISRAGGFASPLDIQRRLRPRADVDAEGVVDVTGGADDMLVRYVTFDAREPSKATSGRTFERTVRIRAEVCVSTARARVLHGPVARAGK